MSVENLEQVAENEADMCIECGAKLISKVGFYADEEGNEQDYDGAVCPTGCNLFAHYI